MQVSLESTNVKIAIGLIGYQSRKEIARCLDGWINHADVFILGDGKFDLYDMPDQYSTDGWLDFAYDRYKEAIEVHTYKFAGFQQDKRQKYLDIAGELGCDYLISIDTDEYVDSEYNNFNIFYKNLILLSRHVSDRMFYMLQFIPSEELWNQQGNNFHPNEWTVSQRIHKDPGSMRYCCKTHYMWCDKDVTDRQIYEWYLAHKNSDIRDLNNPYIFQSNNKIDGVRIRMDRTLRTQEQILKGIEWAHLNQHKENSIQHYEIMKAMNFKPPVGFNSWDEFEKSPHTFDMKTGQRIEINNSSS